MVGPGVYIEDVTLPIRKTLVLDLTSGACIQGNVTQELTSAIIPAGGWVAKVIIFGADLRVRQSIGSNLTGINGNVTIKPHGSVSSLTYHLMMINTGITGTLTWSAYDAGYTGQCFMTASSLHGGITVDASPVGIQCSLYCADVDSSSSSGTQIGPISGKTNLNVLRHTNFTGNVSPGAGSGGNWFAVDFGTSFTHNFSSYSGAIRADANSYANYQANVATKGSETFTLIDDATGVNYTPADTIHWPTAPTQVSTALAKVERYPKNVWEFRYDFEAYTTGARQLIPFSSGGSTADSTATISTPDGTHVGVVVSTITAGTDYIGFGPAMGGSVNTMTFAGGACWIEWCVNLLNLSGVGSQTATLRLGAGDSNTAADVNDGLYIYYTDTNNNGCLSLRALNNGSATQANSGITMTAGSTNTWWRFGIWVSSTGATATAYADSGTGWTLIGAVSSNIPVAFPRTFTAPWSQFAKTAGTSGMSIVWDYAYIVKETTR